METQATRIALCLMRSAAFNGDYDSAAAELKIRVYEYAKQVALRLVI